ncbi:hypothetical protein, partial [Thiorhodovibrio frisius]
ARAGQAPRPSSPHDKDRIAAAETAAASDRDSPWKEAPVARQAHLRTISSARGGNSAFPLALRAMP